MIQYQWACNGRRCMQRGPWFPTRGEADADWARHFDEEHRVPEPTIFERLS